jgi:hypothetical protein
MRGSPLGWYGSIGPVNPPMGAVRPYSRVPQVAFHTSNPPAAGRTQPGLSREPDPLLPQQVDERATLQIRAFHHTRQPYQAATSDSEGEARLASAILGPFFGLPSVSLGSSVKSAERHSQMKSSAHLIKAASSQKLKSPSLIALGLHSGSTDSGGILGNQKICDGRE